jgi:hypothetical protein
MFAEPCHNHAPSTPSREGAATLHRRGGFRVRGVAGRVLLHPDMDAELLAVAAEVEADWTDGFVNSILGLRHLDVPHSLK